MELTIKEMTAQDIPQLAGLERLCFSTPWSENSLKAELQKEDAVFLVARQGITLAGYAGMNCVLDEGYVDNVAVHPDFRRLGIGRALVQALLSEAQNRNLAFLTLEVRPSNLAAVALYQSLGFAQVGRRKGFYSQPSEDGLMMTRYLKR